MTYEKTMAIYQEMQALIPQQSVEKGWIHKRSSFKYSGTPVTRNTYTLNTPLGVFRVYEAISGKTFYEYPYKSVSAENQNHISFSTAKMPCDSIEHGKKICRNKWDKMKLDAFNLEM